MRKWLIGGMYLAGGILGGILHAQTTLVVLDQETGNALPSAHICVESLDRSQASYALSGRDGRLEMDLKEKSLVSVSFVGYESLLDTLVPGGTIRLYLQPSSYAVEEVVVTAQFSPKKLDQSIYKVKVLDNSLVENKGASNLNDLISNELNFSPVRDAALGTSVRIQGLGGEHVKILIDGVPMVGRQNGILDLSQINVSNIDHIEVVEGPMSVVYGSNAMAGVINIITRENKRRSLRAGVDGYYESVGVYDLNADVSLNTGKTAGGLSFGRYFFGGYSEQDTSRAQEWNPKLQYQLDAYYALNGDGWKLKFSGAYFDEELRDLGNLNPDLNYEGAFDYYHLTTRANGTADFSKRWGEAQGLKVTAAYSYYSKTKLSYINDLVDLDKTLIPAPGANDTTVFHNLFSRGSYSNEERSWLSYQVGYEYTQESAVSERLEQTESIGEVAGFLSMNLLPLDKLSIQPGLRYIYNFEYKAPLSYSLNLKWDLLKSTSLRASYSKGFRAPSIKELYLDFQDINHNITGNPDLKAETGNNFNFWADVKLGLGKQHIELGTNAYYNRINQKIELLYDQLDPTAATYFNVPAGVMISRGFSADAKYAFHPRFTLGAGVFHNQLSSIVNTDEFTRNTDYTANFRYKNVKYHFELSLFYKYTDRYSRYVGSMDMETGEIYDVSLSYLDDYHNMDVSLSIPLFQSSTRITVGAKNLFDNKSITSSGGGGVHSGGSGGEALLNWGRTYFMKLTYTFSKFLKEP